MLSFLALNGAAVLVALLVARAAGLSTHLPRHVLATLAGYLIVAHTLVLATGLLGVVSVGGLAAGAVLAMLGAVLLVRKTRDGGAATEPMMDAAGLPSGLAAAPVFCTLSAVLAAVLWLWPHVFGATRLWV